MVMKKLFAASALMCVFVLPVRAEPAGAPNAAEPSSALSSQTDVLAVGGARVVQLRLRRPL